jgi:hypothetical protein
MKRIRMNKQFVKNMLNNRLHLLVFMLIFIKFNSEKVDKYSE